MQVQAQIENFYMELYDYRECRDSIEDVKQFLRGTEIPQVTKHENEKLDQPITPEEVKSFLFSLSNNKAPGNSGLTPAYYKAVWSYTGNLITKAIAQCLQHKRIPECQRKGAIVLIPKSGKDKRYISNLRCLINNGYLFFQLLACLSETQCCLL